MNNPFDDLVSDIGKKQVADAEMKKSAEELEMERQRCERDNNRKRLMTEYVPILNQALDALTKNNFSAKVNVAREDYIPTATLTIATKDNGRESRLTIEFSGETATAETSYPGSVTKPHRVHIGDHEANSLENIVKNFILIASDK